MDFESLDWARLGRLRSLFLGGRFDVGAYWRDEADLAVYDTTFGERIGWKWDAVLRELAMRGWQPPAGCVLWDWGCGSGVAGRRLLGAWGDRFSSLRVTDHSPLASEFAARRAAASFPHMPVSGSPFGESEAAPYVLCVSHVWNELLPESQEMLRRAMAAARAVVWVEPGTHAVARALQGVRDHLTGVAGHRVLAPCTHQKACGLLRPGNEAHWCHHFADPPPEIFANSDWVRFGQRAGVDLRALPYAFLVTERAAGPGDECEPPDLKRVLGSPKVFKGQARALFCGAEGVEELEVPQRVAPAVYKAWGKGRGGELYRTEVDPARPGRVRRITPWPDAGVE